MDTVIASITSNTVRGGWLSSTNGYSTDYTTGITDSVGDSDKVFASFQVGQLSPYVIGQIVAGNFAVSASFTTYTSSIVERKVGVFATTASSEVSAAEQEIANPSESNADNAWRKMTSDDGRVATIPVRKGVVPFSSDENQNAAQSVDVTQAVLGVLQPYQDGTANSVPNLLLWFYVDGAGSVGSTYVTNLSLNVTGMVSAPSVADNSAVSGYVASGPFAPFGALTLSSSVPPEYSGSQTSPDGSEVINFGPFSDNSVVLTGANFYLIVQSDSTSGTLSGPGLQAAPYLVKSGQAGYLISGTDAEITAKLRALTFTPSVGPSSVVTPTTLTIEEFNGLPGAPAGAQVPLDGDVVSFLGAADTSRAVPAGTTEIVLSGGTTVGNSISASNYVSPGGVTFLGDFVYSNETVGSGGIARGTRVSGSVLDVQNGGSSTGTVVGGVTLKSDNISTSTLQGKELVEAGGQSIQAHVLQDGIQVLSAGASAKDPTIDRDGTEEVYGTVDGAEVNGVQNVHSGGQANKTTVGATGTQVVQSGGQAGRTTVSAGGSVTVLSGGQLKDPTIAGGAVVAQDGARVAGTVTFQSGGSLEIDAPVGKGSHEFPGTISGFAAGSRIDLVGLAYSSVSTVTMSGSYAAITNGVATENLRFADPSFQKLLLSKDSGGGTLVTAALAPLISGGRNSTVTPGRDSLPFSGVQVSDPNSGSAETLTIKMSDGGAGGTLSGTGLAGGAGGTYSLSGSPDAVTAELRQLRFTAASLQPNSSVTVTFTLTDTTTVGTSATNTGYSVTVNTPAANPMLTGSAALTTVSEAPVTPFASATLTDPNADSTEALTIQLSNGGAGGVLSGAGLSSRPGGIYGLSGTATEVTAALQALVFTPAVGVQGGSATTTFTLTDQTTAGTTAANTGFSVTNTDPLLTPPPAPTAGADSLTVQSGTSGTLSAAALLLNDTAGRAGDALAVTVVGDARHGSVVLRDGEAVFTPDAGYVGRDAGYSYIVTETGADRGGTSAAVGQVGVTVLAAPAAGASSYIWSGSAPGATYELSGTTTPQLVALQGGTGNNTVLLGSGGGSAHGGGGTDLLIGGGGNDVLTAGTGVTTMTGSGGSNTFILIKGQVTDPTTNGGKYDLITDFKGAGDGYRPGEDFLTLLGFSNAATLAHVGDLAGDASKHVYQATDGAYSAQFLVQYAGGVGSDLGPGDWRTQ